MSPSKSQLESVLAALTPRIEADLSEWYGPNAKLAGAPAFYPRIWSFFFRYRLHVEGREQAILVKIRHARDMDLAQAVASEKIKREAKEEYKSLLHLQDVFGRKEYSHLFFAVRPLALYESLNAVVVEEAGLRSLRSFLQSPWIMASKQAQKTFQGYLGLAGRWLRIFHDSPAQPAGEGPLFTETMYKNAYQNVAAISGFLEPTDRDALKAVVDKLYNTYGCQNASYSFLHDDFTCANIFTTRDNRICSFDPKNRAGPIYADLARLIIDLEFCRVQIFTHGLALSSARRNQFHASILSGYFGLDVVDHALLSFFRLVSLLERWQEVEYHLEIASAGVKFLYTPALLMMRDRFLQHLRMQMLAI